MASYNEKIVDTVFDIVVRFREHKQYGSLQKAAKAFSKRYPGLTSQKEYEEILKFFLDLLEQTIITVERKSEHLTNLSKGFLEKDYEDFVDQLKIIFPNSETKILKTFINWVIYWHFIR